jgi:hypothetical protein
VARDAIARQFDVEKNTVKIEEQPGPSRYQPGKITFFAKKGKSIDIEKIHESLRATRLSGSTNMGVDWFEVTARGDVAVTGGGLLLKVSGTGQEFLLIDGASATTPAGNTATAFGRLATAIKDGGKVTQVTGRVQGWNGKFPVVLKELPGEAVPGGTDGAKRMTLAVTGFQSAK